MNWKFNRNVYLPQPSEVQWHSQSVHLGPEEKQKTNPDNRNETKQNCSLHMALGFRFLSISVHEYIWLIVLTTIT